MSEEDVVRNCAPTLAGLKTGSLFSCAVSSRQELIVVLRRMNASLRPKGLCLLPLRFSEHRVLLYLCRPAKLCRDLTDAQAWELLILRGYNMVSVEKCLAHLATRIQSEGEFPHEVGLFLGYPPEDVRGFIENKAGSSKCTGCWRVYGDPISAQKRFAQFKKCTQIYTQLWAEGKSIEGLTVPEQR